MSRKYKTSERFEFAVTRHADESFAELAKSITSEGCRNPVVIWKESGIVLDGHTRIKICEANGIDWPHVEMSFPNEDAAFEWAILQNVTMERNLTPFARCLAVLPLLPIYEAEAKARMSEGGASAAPGRSKKGEEPVPHLSRDEQTRDKLARLAGVCGRTFDMARWVIENYPGCEEYEAALEGMMAIKTAHTKCRQKLNPPKKKATGVVRKDRDTFAAAVVALDTKKIADVMLETITSEASRLHLDDKQVRTFIDDIEAAIRDSIISRFGNGLVRVARERRVWK